MLFSRRLWNSLELLDCVRSSSVYAFSIENILLRKSTGFSMEAFTCCVTEFRQCGWAGGPVLCFPLPCPSWSFRCVHSQRPDECCREHMAWVPGLAACHGRASLAQCGEQSQRFATETCRPQPKHRAPCRSRRGAGSCSSVVGGWPGKPRCCPWEVAEGATRKSPGATGKSGRLPRGTAGQGESAWEPPREPCPCWAAGGRSSHSRWASASLHCVIC